eukprot:scaffold1397_cov122-Isochrysis_galbana.AAC.4
MSECQRCSQPAGLTRKLMVASIMGAPTRRPTTRIRAGSSAIARHDGTKRCADFSGKRSLNPSSCQLRSRSQSAMHASEWETSAGERSTGPTTPPLPSADHIRVGRRVGRIAECCPKAALVMSRQCDWTDAAVAGYK